MITLPSAWLVLENGDIFEGFSIGVSGMTVGELVFNTSMTGYQEILSDPSYRSQLVVFTAAHIGNTGCNFEDMESVKVQAAGLVVKALPIDVSHYRKKISFTAWLKKYSIVAIAGIDTRALTQQLRDHGALSACITTSLNTLDDALMRARGFKGLKGVDLATQHSRQTIESWHQGEGQWALESHPAKYHVVVYDFGVKHSILNVLKDKGCHITIVPAHTSVDEVLALNPQGIVLSNGPGDPAACHDAIASIQRILETNIPIFGICLGFQLLGLACGARTKKMKFGHHGANHPVLESESHRVWITSQNHGFTLDESSLPSFLKITHRSLFDGTIQGIIHKDKPAFGFQGHPEAGPGPHDMRPLFDQFIKLMS